MVALSRVQEDATGSIGEDAEPVMVRAHWFGCREWLRDGMFEWSKTPSFLLLKNPATNRNKWVADEPLSSILPIVPELTTGSKTERNKDKLRLTAECVCLLYAYCCQRDMLRARDGEAGQGGEVQVNREG